MVQNKQIITAGASTGVQTILDGKLNESCCWIEPPNIQNLQIQMSTKRKRLQNGSTNWRREIMDHWVDVWESYIMHWQIAFW